MNRSLVILFLGLVAGLGAHFGYFAWKHPGMPNGPVSELAWMRDELQLSDQQFQRVVALHQESSKQLRHLAAQILAMQKEMDAFEETRMKYDKIDFVEFARFVDTYRRISQEAESSTRGLVLATADVMNPVQRAHYLELVQPLVPGNRERERSTN